LNENINIIKKNINIIKKNINIIKKNTEALLNIIKDVGLEINAEKTYCIFMPDKPKYKLRLLT
jgi:hypothetical protein